MRKKKAAVLGVVVGVVLGPVLLGALPEELLRGFRFGRPEILLFGPIIGAAACAALGWYLGAENDVKR